MKKYGNAIVSRTLKALTLLIAIAVLPTIAEAQSTAEVNTTGLAVTDDTVKVGSIKSLTGTIAIVEIAVLDAEKMAFDEINASGGVLGRQVELIVEDGASDWPTYADKARKLLEKDKVAAIFACYTSASRKAVLPVVEELDGLLYYPTYYEGMEQSPNILYTGQEATQQTLPAVDWMMDQQGKKTFYFIGSDYVWPRTTNKIARTAIERKGGKVVGEEYKPLGDTNFGALINKIRAARPDAIFSTVVGGSNVAFLKQMAAAGLKDRVMVMNMAVTEEEVRGIGAQNVAGTYTSMGYFQSIDTPENAKFVEKFKATYGDDRVLGDTLAVAYIQPYLWKAAVEKAGSFDVDKVLAASAGLELVAPEGTVKFHETNHHLYKHARIGEFLPDGQVKILYETELIEPDPFPEGF